MKPCKCHDVAIQISRVYFLSTVLLPDFVPCQGCRPLSSATYTVESVGDGGPVVLGLRDERGSKLTPLEALQRELGKVNGEPGVQCWFS